jgi:MFS family permease
MDKTNTGEADERFRLVALIVAVTFFMENLDGTAIATALPQIARSFAVRPTDVSIGMTAYLVTLAVFIPISGWIADRFGARSIFSTAIAILTRKSAERIYFGADCPGNWRRHDGAGWAIGRSS